MSPVSKSRPRISLTWKLLLVPFVAAAGFAVYLLYSSVVLRYENEIFMELRDVDYPILDGAEKNLNTYQRVIDALNTAAATGEIDYLRIAQGKSAEMLARYDDLEKLDASRKDEIEKLKSGFNAFFTLASDIAEKMATKRGRPNLQVIMEMRTLRNAYIDEATAYKTLVEKDFHADVAKAISRSERAQVWGVGIGTFMLLLIASLTWRVTRGILALERNVAERNKELAAVNKELEKEIVKLIAAEKARSQAETASQIKDQFLANMSHELRTPMNAIIGLSHLCLMTEMSQKQNDYLQKIHVSAKSLLGILNDILDISKIEAGKMELDRMQFDLEEVMSNVATIVGNKSQEKKLEFILEIAPDVPTLLLGDPLRLGQVLINLAGNAVKFTEQGEVTVRVELEREEGDGVLLRYTVKDTGIGMTEAEINNLFKPFTQADASITRKFGGTGLGLSISKQLIRLMGGRIWVESKPGAGTRFVFTAQFRKAERQPGYRQSAIRAFSGMRALAVDDSEGSLHSLRNSLESFGFDVVTAGNGADALKLVRRANDDGMPFSLAILDWKMPQMDGVELAGRIAGMDELRTKPKILLISAHEQEGLPQYLGDSMIDGVLSKPLQSSKLFDALASISGGDLTRTGKFKAVSAQFDQELISSIRGIHLLLVEDNEINQQVARELLESFDIKVTTASNGAEAIAMLAEARFDGVLMDMQMPVMDGMTATREIRKNPGYAGLPIIALTANVMANEREQYLEAGMNDQISKPIDPDQLVMTLVRWTGSKQANGNAATARSGSALMSETLPDMPGIKVAESVRRMGRKVELYYSLIERFRSNERDAIDRIRQALATNDHKTAELQAHTLKGLAGTLGAESLQHAAASLETAIKTGNTDLALLLDQAGSELQSFVASIEHALEQRKS